MLKKTLLGAVILMGILVSGLSAGNYTIPSGYTFVKSVNYGALQIYKKGNIYVSIVNLSKAKLNVGNIDEASSNQFVKHSLNSWWSDISNSNILGMYNGQFFSMNGYGTSSTTTLSFPLRSYWSNINTSTDSASQNTIYSEISKWNAMQRDIVMMDGSGSAQMRVGNLKVYGDGFPAYRHLPNVITIEKK